MTPKPDAIYLLPDGRRVMCKHGSENTFLLGQNEQGGYDILVYLIAEGWLYHIVKILGPKHFEWQPSDWMVTDLAEVNDGKTH